MGDVLGLAQREIVRDIVAEGVLEAEIEVLVGETAAAAAVVEDHRVRRQLDAAAPQDGDVQRRDLLGALVFGHAPALQVLRAFSIEPAPAEVSPTEARGDPAPALQ
jgi:hypothetical protein